MKILVTNWKLIFFSLAICFSAPAQDAAFRVVVHPSNNLTSIQQKELADVFLKKKTYWPDQTAIKVVDLAPTSSTRREFSEQVLERSVSAVRNYWQQLLFSGRAVPPPEMKTDQDVLKFVSSHENAIGYVSAEVEVGQLRTVQVK